MKNWQSLIIFLIIAFAIFLLFYHNEIVVKFFKENLEKLKSALSINNTLIFPVSGVVTSEFGNRMRNGVPQFHNGIDIAAPKGTKIRNPKNGKVENVYNNPQGGNQVIVKHITGITTGYAHLDTVLVKRGQEIKEGDIIGTVGSTGSSTGNHLHFTVTDTKGVKIDPRLLFVFA